MDRLKPTQADREAFARMDGWSPGEMGWTSIMEGRDDESVGVQAFARHAHNEYTRGLEARKALEKCAAKFREYEELHHRKLAGLNSPAACDEVMDKVLRNREMAEMCERALIKEPKT